MSKRNYQDFLSNLSTKERSTSEYEGETCYKHPRCAEEIPNAPIWVCANNGHFGDTTILLCNDMNVTHALQNMESHPDYTYPRICCNKPRIRPGKSYRIITPKEGPRFYKQYGW